MPVLHNSDPGEPPGGYFVTEFLTVDADASVAAERVISRLRGMHEVPHEVVELAQARWNADHDLPALLSWIDEALQPYDEPDVIECDCGNLLVDPAAWTGRAVVVCDRCGSRFGVDCRGSGEWSMWALPDPT